MHLPRRLAGTVGTPFAPTSVYSVASTSDRSIHRQWEANGKPARGRRQGRQGHTCLKGGTAHRNHTGQVAETHRALHSHVWVRRCRCGRAGADCALPLQSGRDEQSRAPAASPNVRNNRGATTNTSAAPRQRILGRVAQASQGSQGSVETDCGEDALCATQSAFTNDNYIRGCRCRETAHRPTALHGQASTLPHHHKSARERTCCSKARCLTCVDAHTLP